MYVRILAVLLVVSLGAQAFAQEKADVPKPDQQKQAAREVGAEFKSEYSKAKKPAEQLALAEKLLKTGIATKTDVSRKYVLLRIAQDLALRAGQPKTAMRALDELDRTFKIDVLTRKSEALTKLAKSLEKPAEHRLLIQQLNQVADQAIKAKNFRIALALADLAVKSAQVVEDPALSKRAEARRAKIEEVKSNSAGQQKP